MCLRRFILLFLLPIAPTFAADLPTTDTPVGHLAVVVIPDSLVVSPNSAQLVFAAKAGDPTLADRGIFINQDETNPIDDNARAVLNPIRLYIDDRPTIPFDTVTLPVFSPDSQRLGFAGLHEKTWQLVVDHKTLIQDAEDVPAVPILFSADSAHAAWVVKKGAQYLFTVDDRHWPPIAANTLGPIAFSPDSQHLAAVAHVKTAWTIFVDGVALPLPPAPAPSLRPGLARNPPPGTPQPAPVTARLDRFGQFSWRPDSSGLAFDAAFPGTSWQLFSQALDGAIAFASPPSAGIMNGPPVFSPDGQHLVCGISAGNKWSLLTDAAPTSPAPAAAPGSTAASRPAPPAGSPPASTARTVLGPFDQLLLKSVCYYQAAGAPNQPFTLLFLAEQNKKWHLYLNGHPADDAFDSILQGSFLLSPDRHHYAFAARREGRTLVVRDGTTLATFDECGSTTFAFSPDSQHLAYAARNGNNWFACVDGTPGTPFTVMAGSPLAFSPDSSRVAFAAQTEPKTWRLIVGKDADLESKPYDGFLKGSYVNWRPDGTVVTIALRNKIALRVDAKP